MVALCHSATGQGPQVQPRGHRRAFGPQTGPTHRKNVFVDKTRTIFFFDTNLFLVRIFQCHIFFKKFKINSKKIASEKMVA